MGSSCGNSKVAAPVMQKLMPVQTSADAMFAIAVSPEYCGSVYSSTSLDVVLTAD